MSAILTVHKQLWREAFCKQMRRNRLQVKGEDEKVAEKELKICNSQHDTLVELRIEIKQGTEEGTRKEQTCLIETYGASNDGERVPMQRLSSTTLSSSIMGERETNMGVLPRFFPTSFFVASKITSPHASHRAGSILLE